MEREAAFAAAIEWISNLPIYESAIDFWDVPRVGKTTERAAWQDVSARLEQLAHDVQPEIAFYFRIWASDAAVGSGDLARGLSLLPAPTLGSRESLRVSNRLNLKLELGEPIDAREIICLFGPKVTAFGKRNIDAVERYIAVQLDLRAQQGALLSIADWTLGTHKHPAGYSLFNGHPSYLVTKPPEGWNFPLSKAAEETCTRLIREAENTWREECDLPRVGEGWVAETQLYHAIKIALPHLDVVQHYRPAWLGRQHLDIAIPELKVAIEYQGAQHDRPVAFFGGDEAFARTVERDRRKFNRCRRHGWRLIYAREGYVLDGVLSEIVAF